jgi:hypothetical protein
VEILLHFYSVHYNLHMDNRRIYIQICSVCTFCRKVFKQKGNEKKVFRANQQNALELYFLNLNNVVSSKFSSGLPDFLN